MLKNLAIIRTLISFNGMFLHGNVASSADIKYINIFLISGVAHTTCNGKIPE